MTYTFKLSRRIARLRAPMFAALVLTLIGCNTTDSLAPTSSTPPEAVDQSGSPAFSGTSFPGGIPLGIFAMPITEFGSRYDGAFENIWPEGLRSDLADIRARGGKVVLTFSGSQDYFKDANGHFSMDKWKGRIDRFKSVDISEFVNDGTIIGHYLIDEPNDPANWNGVPISGSTVELMAQYSKQLWPALPTIARAEPSYFGQAHYLDAAWAQYLARRGDAGDYIRRNVADAQSRGLALIVGLNVLNGGDPNGTPMTAAEVETFGSTLLSSSYPCAFISWMYDASYLSSTGVKSAMDVLRDKAQNRSTRSCRASSGSTTPPPPPPPPPPAPTGGALPFGLSEAPMAEYSSRWTGARYIATPADLLSYLGRAQSNGMKLVVKLASGSLKNADGTFSLTRWKAQIDGFRTLALGTYISNKTFYLHDLIEQPSCAPCWGGHAIPWETVEEMARYSKSIWPALPTTLRVAPSQLAKAGFHWNYLDTGWAEYNTELGDLRTFLTAQANRAKLAGLGLVAGLNIVDGSGFDTAPMTASQIKTFGTMLAGDASVCAFVARAYDASYLSQSGIRAALDSVAAVAKRRKPASCVVS
ncbi:MAG: hypothetical protein ACJ8DC_17270 [Gemmatimonadales bacterium]